MNEDKDKPIIKILDSVLSNPELMFVFILGGIGFIWSHYNV